MSAASFATYQHSQGLASSELPSAFRSSTSREEEASQLRSYPTTVFLMRPTDEWAGHIRADNT